MFSLLFLALAGVVGAQAPLGKACCVANKFTATLLQLQATLAPNSTVPKINDGYIGIDYDYDNKLSKLDVHTLNAVTGKYDNVVVFNDYPNDKLYTEVNGACYVTKMNGTGVMTQPCVPANFTALRQYKLGGGASAIDVEVFAGTVMGMRILIHVEPGSCTPIAQSTYGDAAGTRELTSYLFADVVQGKLSSANPFELSQACKTASSPLGRRSLDYRTYFG